MALWVQAAVAHELGVSAAASRLGLDVPPGPRFGVDGTLERFIRVPYTLPDDQLAEAVELLAPRRAQCHRVIGARTRRGGRLAFHQFADMGADRIRKTLKVVPAFEHRHEAAFAVRLCRFHQFTCHPSEIAAVMANGPSDRVHDINPADTMMSSRLNVSSAAGSVLECFAEFGAAVAGRKRRVEDIVPHRFRGLRRCREKRHLMRRGVQHAGIG